MPRPRPALQRTQYGARDDFRALGDDAEFAGELCDFCEKALREHAGKPVSDQ